MTNGKVLGVDYGDVRTGLAISDPCGILASGIGTIKEPGMKHTAKKVAEEAQKQGAIAIVVGLPKNMDGTEGFRSDVVKAFVELLKEEINIPIEFLDERLSTVQAHTMMNLTGTHGKKRKENVDTLSAQIILQDYLDRQK